MTIAVVASVPTFLSLEGASSGTSQDAGRIASKFMEFICRFSESATGNQRISQPAQEIYELLRECGKANWDNEGAQPLTKETVQRAEQTLMALPSYLPVPEISADPTGAISFEWIRGPRRRFVMSIYASGSIEFAGLLGVGNEVYGAARMGDGLPRILQAHLRELFTD